MGKRKSTPTQLWQAYSENWVRHLCVVAEETEQRIKSAMEARGYENLSTSLIYPLSILSLGPIRPGRLADKMGISQQLCTKVQRRLTTSGYTQTSPDPEDGRARQLTLSGKGQQLINDALSELQAQSEQYTAVLGQENAEQLNSKLQELGQLMAASSSKRALQIGAQSNVNAIAMSGVSRVIQYRIAKLNSQRGHKQLRASHWRVIHQIGLEGATIGEVAKTLRVTTQAITHIAGDLEQMGYIARNTDVNDRRSRRLTYAKKGYELLASTVDSITALGQEIEQYYPSDFQHLKTLLQSLHAGFLGLNGAEILPFTGPSDQNTSGKGEDDPELKMAIFLHIAERLGLTDPSLKIPDAQIAHLHTFLASEIGSKQIKKLDKALNDILSTSRTMQS